MKHETEFSPLTLKQRRLMEPGMGRYRLFQTDGTAVTLRARSALDALSTGKTQEVRRMMRHSYESAALIDDSWLTGTAEAGAEAEHIAIPLPELGAPAGEAADSATKVYLPATFQRGLHILTLEEMRRELPAGEARFEQSPADATKPLTEEDVKKLLSGDETTS